MNFIIKNMDDALAIIKAKAKLPKIETLRKGDYFRFPGKKTTYVFVGYCRVNKKYEYHKLGDFSTFGYRHKGTTIEVDFTC